MKKLLDRSPVFNATVTRQENGEMLIGWENDENARSVSIFAGPSPEKVDRDKPLAEVNGVTRAVIAGLDPEKRHYFEIVPEGGSGLLVAERRVPIDGTYNFRDLGGYETSAGQRVKWGQIYRSDGLSRLGPKGVAQLKGLGLRTIFDFRTDAEVDKAPDRLPGDGSFEYVRLPIQHGEFNFIAAMERVKQGDDSWLDQDFMIRGYLENIDDFPQVWGEFFGRLAEARSRPLVFHCTGGKDRAGTAAALILLALGVPEETVIRDHGLSNVYIAPLLPQVYQRMRDYGVDPEKLSPYFTAPPEAIEALLEHLRRRYGSAEKYLTTWAGLTAQVLARLRLELLV